MRFLLITAFFAFQTLCASGPTPSFFDGIETAKKITDRRSKTSQSDLAHQDYKNIQKAKAAQFDLACQDYYDVLKATPRLSRDDEPEILAGYLAIANYFYEKKNQAAISDHEILVGKPSQAHYQDLLKKLQAGGALFEPAFKKNFGLSVINLLERTREESQQNLLIYKRKMVKPKYRRIFLKMGRRLTAGMEVFDKLNTIDLFGRTPMERLVAIDAEFTTERLQNVQRYIESGNRSYFLRRLCDTELSAERIADINATIQGYMARIQQPVVPSREIHDYSRTTVITDKKQETNSLNAEIIILLKKD